MAGTGKLEHDEEEGDGGRKCREDLGSAGERLSVAAVHQTMTAQATMKNIAKTKCRCEAHTGCYVAGAEVSAK